MARASATYRGEREVILQFPYDPELIAALKEEIPAWARSYDPQAKIWTVTSVAWVTAAVALLQEHYPNAAIGREAPPPPPPPPPCDDSPRWRMSRPSGHHATLHLLPTAPREVIDAAYRALAKLHHPDLAPATEKESATTTMQTINEAYRSLTQQG